MRRASATYSMRRMVNKIALEDCVSFLEKLPLGVADMAVIDPPYNMGKGEWDTFPNAQAFFQFTERWIDAFLPKMKPGGSFYIFNSPLNSARILRMLEERGAVFLNWITWHKRDGISGGRRKYACNQETILFFSVGRGHVFNADDVREPYHSEDRMRHAARKGILKNGRRWFPNPGGRLCSDVWEFSSHRHKAKVNGKVVKPAHPTPKPEDMIERMVRASSVPGDLVLDLFSGTGTTAVICRKLGRNFIGCEINPEYRAIALERMRHADNQPAA